MRDSENRLRAFSGQLEQLVQKRTEELMQSHDRLRELATELNLAEQRERKRLAAELHDHLQQLLVLGRLKLGQGKELVETPAEVCTAYQRSRWHSVRGLNLHTHLGRGTQPTRAARSRFSGGPHLARRVHAEA